MSNRFRNAFAISITTLSNFCIPTNSFEILVGEINTLFGSVFTENPLSTLIKKSPFNTCLSSPDNDSTRLSFDEPLNPIAKCAISQLKG